MEPKSNFYFLKLGYTEEVCQTMKDHFWCSIENRCLPISIRCNYIQECFDAFDELDCNGKILFSFKFLLLIFILLFLFSNQSALFGK